MTALHHGDAPCWSTPLVFRPHGCAEDCLDADQASVPITGWALAALAQLDRGGARGLIADLSTAGILSRQAADVTFAELRPDRTAEFLGRLDIGIACAEEIGCALGNCRARQIIAAAFGVEPDDVPTGYLRALAKIEEVGACRPGLHAFKDPATYRRLFDILTGERKSRRAHALRYSTRLRSTDAAGRAPGRPAP